jgi:hypothetical protein
LPDVPRGGRIQEGVFRIGVVDQQLEWVKVLSVVILLVRKGGKGSNCKQNSVHYGPAAWVELFWTAEFVQQALF